jgi:hypothetical protein
LEIIKGVNGMPSPKRNVKRRKKGESSLLGKVVQEESEKESAVKRAVKKEAEKRGFI